MVTGNNPPPIFISGAARSGTNFIRNFLSTHKNIALLPFEIGFEQIYCDKTLWSLGKRKMLMYPYWLLFKRKEIKRAGNLLRYGIIQHALHFETGRYQNLRQIRSNLLLDSGVTEDLIFENLSLSKKDFERHLDIYDTILKGYMQLQGKTRYGDKSTYRETYIPMLMDYYGDLRHIYIVRDPRASICSAKYMKTFPKVRPDYDLRREIELRRSSIGKAIEIDQNLEKKQNYFVRYEDLSFGMESILRDIAEFLEEDPTLFHPEKMSGKANSTFRKMDKNKVSFSKKESEVWKEHLSRDEIGEIQEKLKEKMMYFDYPVV